MAFVKVTVVGENIVFSCDKAEQSVSLGLVTEHNVPDLCAGCPLNEECLEENDIDAA